MYPLFGDDKRRREINLGGASFTTTHTTILDQAKARRSERQDLRRRQDSAIVLQAWWRGIFQARATRQELRKLFCDNVTGLTGMRCLVLIGKDEEALGRWSAAMATETQESLFKLARGPYSQSWIVLVRQIGVLLMQSVSERPQSPYAVSHLQVLNALLSSPEVAASIAQYLVRHEMYRYLSLAITKIPLNFKASDLALPLLIPLITMSLSTVYASSSEMYEMCLRQLFQYILTIPILPNRLPLPSLALLSSGLPFASLSVLGPLIPQIIPSLTIESRVHLIANLITFVPPRYRSLTSGTLETYLNLLAELMNAVPVNALDPTSATTSRVRSSGWGDGDSDSDAKPEVVVVKSFESRPVLPDLDQRTLKRLQSLPDVQHLSALLSASQHHPSIRPSLIRFFFALGFVWPARRQRMLGAVVVHTGGGLVRELYRGYVRSSPLGRDDNPGSIMDPSSAVAWPPLLFLADLYTHSLLTMGDDEFFSNSSASAGASSAPRNPLTVDELISFSRKLLNIAFVLYWREDQNNVQEGSVPGLNLKWEDVREKITKCLQAIHARDSRKSFTPAGHWLVSSQVDMNSFIEAAIFEEQQINLPAGSQRLSKRQISYIAPRLGVLHNIPFAIHFEVRVSIFRQFVVNDMIKHNGGHRGYIRSGRTRISVRRGNVAQDGFDKLGEADLKAPVEITFIDQFGQEEAGIDGGGVFKEFLTSLCKEVFDTDRGLWLANKRNELYPNPHAYATEPHSLNWYRFIGRILGKALYEGILVDVAFAGFFLAKWLEKQSFLDDLASLDPELYQGLIFLKHYTGNPEELSLNFTVATEEFGVTKTIDLIPNGSNIPVTRENRLQYIHLVSHYRLTKQIKLQSEAFFEGLSDMIDPKWLRMFNQQELQILLGGVNSPIDLDDLRKNTNYGGLYDDEHETILLFWKVVNSFNQEQRQALLRFVTSCSRPPLLGFKELVPNFAIRDAGSDENRLPTSSTCVNLLKLPRYKNESTLRGKLVQAINAGAGFDLS